MQGYNGASFFNADREPQDTEGSGDECTRIHAEAEHTDPGTGGPGEPRAWQKAESRRNVLHWQPEQAGGSFLKCRGFQCG